MKIKTKSKPLTNKVGDVRELRRDDFRQMRPMREVDPVFVAKWEAEQKRRGRPVGRSKNVVSISLDKEVIDALRKTGNGWQTRLNELAKAALGLTHPSK